MLHVLFLIVCSARAVALLGFSVAALVLCQCTQGAWLCVTPMLATYICSLLSSHLGLQNRECVSWAGKVFFNFGYCILKRVDMRCHPAVMLPMLCLQACCPARCSASRPRAVPGCPLCCTHVTGTACSARCAPGCHPGICYCHGI